MLFRIYICEEGISINCDTIQKIYIVLLHACIHTYICHVEADDDDRIDSNITSDVRILRRSPAEVLEGQRKDLSVHISQRRTVNHATHTHLSRLSGTPSLIPLSLIRWRKVEE